MNDSTLFSYITNFLITLFTSGSLVGFLTWWNQRKRGIRQDDRDDNDSFSRRTQDLLKTQIEYLVKPLQEEIERQKKTSEEQGQELKHVKAELKSVQTQVDQTRTQYWQAIGYIRQLLNWHRTHVPKDVPTPPDIPEALIKDI